jgi:putative ABC transport system substrate-binding protein
MRRAVSRRWQNSQVTVIAIPNTTQSAITAKAATQTIPIVFSLGSNPVEVGFVQSLNHPGGNVTGLTALQTAVTAKRLELVHQLIPGITKIAFLVNPANQALSAFDPKRTCNPEDLLRCHFDLAMRRSDRCP